MAKKKKQTLIDILYDKVPATHRHYKGGKYTVICIGKVEANPRYRMVVYRCCKTGVVWIRPLGDFEAWVDDPRKPGKWVRRFKNITSEGSNGKPRPKTARNRSTGTGCSRRHRRVG